MEAVSLEKQVLGLMEVGRSVPAGYGLDSYAQSLGAVRTRCMEYQGQGPESGGGNARFSSWRGQGSGSGSGSGSRHGSGHNTSNNTGSADRFPKSNQGKTTNGTPIVNSSATPVSNVKGAWTSATKKAPTMTVPSVSSPEQAHVLATASVTTQAPVTTQVTAQVTPQAPVTAQVTHSTQSLYKPPSSHRGSGFNKSKEEVQSNILNTMILGKLNKFTEENYDPIKQFLGQILSNDETDFLKEFMVLVFKKATNEKIYCALYVRLIAELSAEYPIIKTELMNLYDTYIKEFEKIEEDKEEGDYDLFCASQREKIYRLGYGQFLAQLTRVGILDAAALIRMYNTLLALVSTYSVVGMNHRNQVEEMCACMSSMTQAFQKEKNPALVAIRNAVAAECKTQMDSIIKRARSGELTGLSARGRCALMDCVDILIE